MELKLRLNGTTLFVFTLTIASSCSASDYDPSVSLFAYGERNYCESSANKKNPADVRSCQEFEYLNDLAFFQVNSNMKPASKCNDGAFLPAAQASEILFTKYSQAQNQIGYIISLSQSLLLYTKACDTSKSKQIFNTFDYELDLYNSARARSGFLIGNFALGLLHYAKFLELQDEAPAAKKTYCKYANLIESADQEERRHLEIMNVEDFLPFQEALIRCEIQGVEQ